MDLFWIPCVFWRFLNFNPIFCRLIFLLANVLFLSLFIVYYAWLLIARCVTGRRCSSRGCDLKRKRTGSRVQNKSVMGVSICPDFGFPTKKMNSENGFFFFLRGGFDFMYLPILYSKTPYKRAQLIIYGQITYRCNRYFLEIFFKRLSTNRREPEWKKIKRTNEL